MYSQVIYGSCARKDNDVLSDKDMGIFFNDTRDISESLKKYTEDGWSCATYTYEKLMKMADLGLLFVQHIKQDGIIISDYDSKLKNILQSFSPKQDFSDEISDAIKLSTLTNYIPMNISCVLWALDITSVAVRNFSIAFFATNGIYEFSAHKLYSMLAKHFNLSNEDLTLLHELRRAKYSYRHNLYKDTELASYIEILNGLNVILNKIGFKRNTYFGSCDGFICLANDIFLDTTVPVYYKIRLSELLFSLKNTQISNNFKNKYSHVMKLPHADPYSISSAQLYENLFKDLILEIS